MYSLQQRIAIVEACVRTGSMKEKREIFAGNFPGVGLPTKSIPRPTPTLAYETKGRFFVRHAVYTGCSRRNGQNFGRVFLMLNYTDITQNTYTQS